MQDLSEEKTPPAGPFAMQMQRIEDGIRELRTDMARVCARTDRALDLAFEAHQTAKMAMWARASWGPYVVSALAFAMAFAACASRR